MSSVSSSELFFYIFFSAFLVSERSAFSFLVLQSLPAPSPSGYLYLLFKEPGLLSQTGRSISFKKLLLSVLQEFLRLEKTKSLTSSAYSEREGNGKLQQMN